jgi:hypothetical protein
MSAAAAAWEEGDKKTEPVESHCWIGADVIDE